MTTDHFTCPIDAGLLLRKKKAIRRELLKRPISDEKRIAVLGGSTTAEVRDMLELFLLADGIRPSFFESDYNRYFEDVMFSNEALRSFSPDLVYIHTSAVNITRYPLPSESAEDVVQLLQSEADRFGALWDKIASDYNCPIIQNNFELPHYRGLGNLDAYAAQGRTRFVAELNRRFSDEARARRDLKLNDIHYLSAWFGLERWYDKTLWYSSKYAMSYEAIPLVAQSVAAIVRAIFGRTRKCLVLDLDNTLWGGVIGDDGLDGIQIGKETPEAEAYTEFQQYIKALRDRGVILAVCSRNDEKNAREGFEHPDSVLRADDFSAFRANWEPKHENVRAIARSLNIGVDSLVFADDSPSERDLVKAQVPDVAVPELGSDVSRYIDVLDKSGLFETISLSPEDLLRSAAYAGNTARADLEKRYETYGDFLRSLEMVAEIGPFKPIYLDRITQLTNKTNQFNLTTRRYTRSEMDEVAANPGNLTLYGRLKDKFGDSGIVSVMIGSVQGAELHLDLWLMSCRVLKRGMEEAMLDELVARARSKDMRAIVGYYFPTARNAIVKELFQEMGFEIVSISDKQESIWKLDISAGYENRSSAIKVSP